MYCYPLIGRILAISDNKNKTATFTHIARVSVKISKVME